MGACLALARCRGIADESAPTEGSHRRLPQKAPTEGSHRKLPGAVSAVVFRRLERQVIAGQAFARVDPFDRLVVGIPLRGRWLGYVLRRRFAAALAQVV